MRYTTQKPTEPGWYWCKNAGDCPGRAWEAIGHVGGGEHGGLVLSWMTSLGNIGELHERDWSPKCEWAGPISPPANEEPKPGEAHEGGDACARQPTNGV